MIRLNVSQILVAGAGGFIGGHLTKALISEGFQVLAVDVKPKDQWHQLNESANNRVLDLRLLDNCELIMSDIDVVYNLAADMGGMGFIEKNKAACMLSVLINTHLLMSASRYKVKRYFFASSACVYAHDRQTSPEAVALREEDAYPAMPEDGYGWEKLFSERMCRHFLEDFGVPVRIGRYHNVYGPYGTYFGGREKAPAALCRKVAYAALNGFKDIEIWGDGNQTRSFTYIDDCLTGTLKLVDSDCADPMNIGSAEMVSVNDLLTIIEEFAGLKLRRNYNLNAPQGVRGRNSDNTFIRSELKWEPTISLRFGIEKTYRWIFDEMSRSTGF
jgi:GDP-D-mannose 3',5'-epimerase